MAEERVEAKTRSCNRSSMRFASRPEAQASGTKRFRDTEGPPVLSRNRSWCGRHAGRRDAGGDRPTPLRAPGLSSMLRQAKPRRRAGQRLGFTAAVEIEPPSRASSDLTEALRGPWWPVHGCGRGYREAPARPAMTDLARRSKPGVRCARRRKRAALREPDVRDHGRRAGQSRWSSDAGCHGLLRAGRRRSGAPDGSAWPAGKLPKQARTTKTPRNPALWRCAMPAASR